MYYELNKNQLGFIVDTINNSNKTVCVDVFPGLLQVYFSRIRKPVEVVNDSDNKIYQVFSFIGESLSNKYSVELQLKNDLLCDYDPKEHYLEIISGEIKKPDISFVSAYMYVSCQYLLKTNFSVFGIDNKWFRYHYILDAWRTHLMCAQIDNRNFETVINYWDGENTIFYIDAVNNNFNHDLLNKLQGDFVCITRKKEIQDLSVENSGIRVFGNDIRIMYRST